MNSRQRSLWAGLVPLFWLGLIASILGLLNPMNWSPVARSHAEFLALTSILELIFFIALAVKTDLVRDTTPQPPSGQRPYSLARVQAAFWLYIVSIVYLRMLSYASDPLKPPVPNETALVLLSLSLITVTASAYVDSTKEKDGQNDAVKKEEANPPSTDLARQVGSNDGSSLGEELRDLGTDILNVDQRIHDRLAALALAKQKPSDDAGTAAAASQASTDYYIALTTKKDLVSKVRRLLLLDSSGVPPVSQGFVSDILNDSGTNLHRLQLILWNLMLGIGYLYEGLTQSLVLTPMPTYGKEIYALLGVSSAAYVVLKGSEDPKGTNESPSGTAK
jgi:hypothetical protein